MNNTQGLPDNPYQEFVRVIPAGEGVVINCVHDYFRLLALDLATVEIKIGGTGAWTSIIDAGVGIKHPQTVDRISLRNTGGAAVTLTCALAIGEISDDRLNISGVVSVDDNGGSLTIDNPELSRIAGAGREESAYMYVGSLFKAPLTNLDGATHARVNNATTTLVTAVANTDGLIIRHVDTDIRSGEGGYISLSGNRIYEKAAVSGVHYTDTFGNILVPSGVSLIVFAGVTTTINIDYEVL